MKRSNTRALAGGVLLACLIAAAPAVTSIRGYSPDAGQVQRDWETKFRAMPDPDSLREYMRVLTARPHHLGSPYGQANAEWLLGKFRSWGWQADIVTYQVLFPTPKQRVLELVAPTRFVASLQEPAVPGDPTSTQRSEQLPTYNAYSIDGDVTAPLVFVNYGIPADYDRLERMGISVQGAIVIAKYGHSWRGIKPKVAAEHGAVGCIIYSDPDDDGYHTGDTYPKGAYRSAESVQRGSVMDMPVYPGDPLTPGVGATADAQRLDRSEARTITRIPVLPISYADAQPLLAAIGGRVAPQGWQGGLPITYHIGPGPARVHLKLAFDWKLTPLHDVIARIPGSTTPDEWVVRGNHHDGWVNGAADPVSGLVAELEEARALGQLLTQGWKPARTIVYAAWDGEEPSLLGSTEWVEDNAPALERSAVAYLNTDGNGRGFLEVGGSHSLEKFINEVVRDVTDPETGMSVWKRRWSQDISKATTPKQRKEIRERPDIAIEALGSGSDFTPFLQHLGVASLNLGFSGEGSDGGVYHSIYDDFSWFTRFSDTSFVYGRALSQIVGTAVMRLASAQVLPYDFTALAETVSGYVEQLQTLAQASRDSIIEQNRQISEGVFSAVADPQEPSVAPGMETVPPFLNFAPVENALARLTLATKTYDTAFAAINWQSATDLDAVNSVLLAAERGLTSGDGLPGRTWYRHQLYAPGAYTGYGVKTVPGVREAIEQGQWDQAQQQIDRVAATLNGEAEIIEKAAGMLGGR